MPKYRRSVQPGGTFFFTQVTYRRQPLFRDEKARALLRQAIAGCRQNHPFAIEAFVLLPDHLHTIWTLPEEDADFSTRWRVIKQSFTRAWLSTGGEEIRVTVSGRCYRHHGVWQRGFWEHRIRDQDDLNRHLNYIHYNPVKHNLVSCPHEWPNSTFAAAVARGLYAESWCCACEGRPIVLPDLGELELTAME